MKPERKEILALLACAIGVVYALRYDTVRNQPRPYWDFYVDSYGLYYFRQAALVHFVYWMGFAAAHALVARINSVRKR